MSTSIILFTRDLRVRDNPALSAACQAEQVVSLFVFNDAILNGRFAAPNRVRFLHDGLGDLRRSLRRLGGDLVVRRGDPVAEVARLSRATGARSLFLAEDRSVYATRRLAALRELDLTVSACPGVTVVPPGALTPAGGDHYRVFTLYWRAWARADRRPVADTPRKVRLASGVDPRPLPRLAGLTSGATSSGLATGGEGAGRERMAVWLAEDAAHYDEARDDLAADRTSRLSPYLRFGCVSPLGLRHFSDWLADGDIADNAGNWQWVAGTGNDTRPNRVMNPLRQASRLDPSGDYVRAYVPELAGIEPPHVHRPWTLPTALRPTIDYPPPIVHLE